jgi:FHA domain
VAKLIISLDGNLVDTRFIEEGTVTIGSAIGNDIRLKGAGVSRRHARILSVANDDILEDLGSANGTRVNGVRINQHILKNDDIVEIADFSLRYRNQKAKDAPSFDRTMFIVTADLEPGETARSALSAQPAAVRGGYRHVIASTTRRTASLQDLKLPGSAPIMLPYLLRTIGDAATSLAVINTRPHGYFITHVAGAESARLNGTPIGSEMRRLTNGDVIEIANERLQFVEDPTKQLTEAN